LCSSAGPVTWCLCCSFIV